MVCAIPLHPSECGLVTLVDSRDFDWVASVRWTAQRVTASGHTYAVNFTRGAGGLPHTISLHRAITEAPGGMWVDHVDRNGLNNCRSNLRLCTPSQNAANRRKPRLVSGIPTSSRYKGVSWVGPGSGWLAAIGIRGKNVRLGLFAIETDAALAYDAAARQHFGPFARVNFPNPGEQAA